MEAGGKGCQSQRRGDGGESLQGWGRAEAEGEEPVLSFTPAALFEIQ